VVCVDQTREGDAPFEACAMEERRSGHGAEDRASLRFVQTPVGTQELVDMGGKVSPSKQEVPFLAFLELVEQTRVMARNQHRSFAATASKQVSRARVLVRDRQPPPRDLVKQRLVVRIQLAHIVIGGSSCNVVHEIIAISGVE